MEIILKKDIAKLGYKNDIVTVKPGYGRNYLIPNGLAVLAISSERKRVSEDVRQAAHKAERIKADAEALAAQIGNITIEIGAKSGETGKIFGAVTPIQVSEMLMKKGFDVDRRKISFSEQPKQLGSYTALLDLHKEVKHTLSIEVVAE